VNQTLARLWVGLGETDGRLRVGREGSDAPVLVARCGLEVNGETQWLDLTAGAPLPPGAMASRSATFTSGVEWSVRFELSADATTLLLGSCVSSSGRAPVRLGRCHLLHGTVGLGETAADTVMLCCSGTTSPSRVRRIGASEEPLRSKTIAQLYSAKAKLAFHAGFLTFDRMNTEHHASPSEDGIRVELGSFCDFAGFELPPGGTVETERLMVQVGADPLASLEAWAERAAEFYQPPIWPKIPAGWVGWAWVDGFNVEPYESVVLRNAAALRRRLTGHDLEYVWVSIGNLRGGLPGNWIEWNYDLFPRGVEFLVRELAARDLKLGLWMGSFWMADAISDRVEALSDAFLRQDGEPLVVNRRWSYGEAGLLAPEERPNMIGLDPTHPKAHAFLRQVLQTYYGWGVRYYMIDFLHAISDSTPGDFIPDGYHDTSLIRGPETYRAGLKAVREAAGEDTYLLSSSGPTYLNVGYMDAARVGNDYGEGRALNPNSYFYPATFVINNAGFWTSHRAATDALAAGSFTHRKLYLADSGNLLTVDKPIPLGEAQIAATIFGINGGPMMLGDDIDRMAEERLALIRKCLPRLPECARPADLFDCPEPDYVKTFHLRVEAPWDKWDLVAVFNYGQDALRQAVDPATLGLDAEGGLEVWDFWAERRAGTKTGPFDAWVAPNSATLLRLSRRRGHPWIISTDMHVRQGQAEIEDCRWSAEAMALTFRASRPAGETGSVFVHVPEGLFVANPEGLWIAKDANDNSLIVRVAFEFGEEADERTIRFGRV
jgi:hypothetical protein